MSRFCFGGAWWIGRRMVWGVLVLSLLGLSPKLGTAGPQVEFRPSISLTQEYDDNIFLEEDNEESDFITSFTPGAGLTVKGRQTSLDLFYAPSFVKYYDNSEHDTVRHEASLDLAHDFTPRLSLSLSDRYIRSEDPIDEGLDETQEDREGRNTYQRNTATGSLAYQFSQRGSIGAGYRHSLLIDDDPDEEDGTQQGPFANLGFQISSKDGLNAAFSYTRVRYEDGDDLADNDEYDGYSASGSYYRDLTQRTSGTLSYGYTTRDFLGNVIDQDDYDVHNVSVGIRHAVSPHLNVFASGGYFWVLGEETEDTDGYTFGGGLTSNFERGSISVSADRGWDEGPLEADQRNFTEFWSVTSRLSYTFLQHLNAYASGYYRENDERIGDDDELVRVGGGLNWQLHQWYYLTLDYTHHRRTSQDEDEEYIDNRVSLGLSYQQPFRIQ